MGYAIVGDTEKYKGCLICAVHGDKERAEAVLDRMLNAPTDSDKRNMEGHTNIRVAQTDSAWWEE